MLVPVLFCALGTLAGSIIRVVIARVSRTVSSRLEIGPADPERPRRASGVVLRRDQLARIVPHCQRTCGWLSTIDRWDAEYHEVTIALERDVVSDGQAPVRRTRVAEPDKV